MNVQLLLLLALVGPFCAFTHASPTEIPPELGTTGIAELPHVTGAAAATEASKEDLPEVTGPPATEPAAVPAQGTEVAVTEAAPAITVANTEASEADTSAATETQQPLTTNAHPVETAAPTTVAEGQPEVTAAAETETKEGVVVEGETEEGMTSGQVAGIVIGALLAVVIVTCVVVGMVRRMGKYSP